MQLIQGFKNSYYLLTNSLGFLKKNPDLIILPVLSILALVFLLFSGIKVLLYFRLSEVDFVWGLVPIYFLLVWVSLLFNAAFVAAVLYRLQGKKRSIFRAMLIALKRLGSLLIWTMISATVGVVLSMLERLSDFFAKIITKIFGFSWTLNSCFVLPTMLMQNVKPMVALKQSAQLVGKGWRNISSLNFLLLLVMLVLGGIAYFLASLLLHTQYTFNLTINLPLTLALVVCWLISIKTFNAIYNSALYLTINEKQFAYFDASLLKQVIIA